MLIEEVEHPASDVLVGYGLGKLPADRSGEVETHISQCPSCCEVVAGAEDDGLIVRLRETQARSSAVTPTPQPGVTEQLFSLPPAVVPGGAWGRLGDYQLLQVLRSGGMGTVFVAEDVKLRRRVALKVMRPEIALRPQARERFLREARAVATLEHEHIVAIFHVGEQHGAPFLVMPLLKGMSLDDRINQGQRWTIAEVLRLGREVALGLAAAHEHGIIHRDVKPGNLWLEPDGRVKILDFGLARLREEENLTRVDQVLGTPSYMAPEQAGGQPVDGRADLFGLGCVLYQLCAGRPPFPRASADTTGLTLESPPPVRSLKPEIPEQLDALILKLLAREPARRPASAADVARLLGNLERELAGGESPVGDTSPGSQGNQRRTWWRWLIPVLVLGLLTLLLLTLAFQQFQVIRVETGRGTLVVKTSVPDVKVVVKQDGQQVTIIDPKQQKEITLDAGNYELELAGGPKGLKLSAERFTLYRDGEKIVRVYFEKAEPRRVWRLRAPLPKAASSGMMAAWNGRLYFVGGGGVWEGTSRVFAEVQVYHPATNRWEERAPIPRTGPYGVGRYGAGLGLMDDKLYLAGGWQIPPSLPSRSLFVYDLVQDSWTLGRPLPELSCESVAGVIDKKLYLYTTSDGWASGRSRNTYFHRYDPQTGLWARLPVPPQLHIVGGGAVLGDKFYLVGGSDIDHKPQADLHMYNPAANEWTTLAPMPTARSSVACAVVGGKLYAVGGVQKSKVLRTVEVYDPNTGQWAELPPLRGPRSGASVAAIGQTIYVVGGGDGKGLVATVEALDLGKAP
jgi:serine/threonine protein kinase/N-acetylneuraminic acid mutarotase